MTQDNNGAGGERKILYPPEQLSKNAYVKNMDEYKAMYDRSINDVDAFWGEMAETLDWYKKWDNVYSWDVATSQCTWFAGGKLNVSYNCLDRHVKAGKGDKVAIKWEGDEPGNNKTITYGEMLDQVSRFANVLKKYGVKKGDRVCIYLPMILELPMAMLACARIGAVHSVVFGGFSAEAMRDRILDSDCQIVICADTGFRSGKQVPLKKNVDGALEECPNVRNVFVAKHSGADIPMVEGRDLWWSDEIAASDIAAECEPEQMDAEDPLFILYTSGSTGKPKGVLHTSAGYLLHASLSLKYIFDIHEDDLWWCTADIGWVTGHSYIVYGPLCNGFTELMFEGVPTYPKPDRFWAVCEDYKVTHFYTAPTVIRSLMREGESWIDLARPLQPQGPRLGGRAHQPRCVAVVLRPHRRRTLPHRRHLVADGDRRHPHYRPGRRHSHEAGFGQLSLLRCGPHRPHPGRQAGGDRGERLPLHQEALAGHDADHL